MKGYNQLNLEERTIIWRMHEKGKSLLSIFGCISKELTPIFVTHTRRGRKVL